MTFTVFGYTGNISIIDLVIATFILILIFVLFRKKVIDKYQLKNKQYEYSLHENSNINYTRCEDIYTHTTETRVEKPREHHPNRM